MELRVDGSTDFQIEGEPEKLLDAINAVVQAMRAQQRAVVGVLINGEPHSPESLSEDHAETVLASIDTLDISTRAVAELIEESLEELEQSLPDLPKACRQLAEVFQSESPEEGFEPFTELARIWEHVKLRQQMLAEVMDVDLSAVEIDGRPLQEHSEELNDFLHEAAQALQDGDTVLLGDLLEYELAPRAEMETRITDALRQATPSS